MKHLKPFNESSVNKDDIRNRLNMIINEPIFTPPADKVLISDIYTYVLIGLSSGKWLTIDVYHNVEIWNSRQDAIDNVSEETTGYDQHFEFDDFTNIIDCNDINLQEIENILIDIDLVVNDVWVIKR